jgi:hypothetical protein
VRTLACILIGLACVLVSGCDRPGGKAHDPAALDAHLTIILDGLTAQDHVAASDNATCTLAVPHSCTIKLVCVREAGTMASWAVSGCAWLDENASSLFQKPDPDVACTEIYGGDQTAHVTGRLNGRRIDYSITRADGCQIRLWDLHAPLWSSDAPPPA